MPDLKTNLGYLNSFASVDTDWSGNPMKSVSASVLNLAEYILHHLPVQPVLNLTGRSTVQMEYHKPDGQYFEIEVFDEEILVMKIGKGEAVDPNCWQADFSSAIFWKFAFSSVDLVCGLASKFLAGRDCAFPQFW